MQLVITGNSGRGLRAQFGVQTVLHICQNHLLTCTIPYCKYELSSRVFTSKKDLFLPGHKCKRKEKEPKSILSSNCLLSSAVFFIDLVKQAV